MRKKLTSNGKAASCYFRSSVVSPHRKALVQITERCNLFCAHCFVSAGNYGDTMSIEDIEKILIPRLITCRVVSVSLTGGEPFVHPNILEIVRLLRRENIKVTICTNATCITDFHVKKLIEIGGVHCNVSLDGFSPESHGKFRGNSDSFAKTIQTIRILGNHHLLQGLLATPNNLAKLDEYSKICEFGIEAGAEYVLMNPLSSMGRGVNSISKLSASREMMKDIAHATAAFSEDVELVRIRFPNEEKLPLASCEAGNILYIFTRGELTICPYLVFAAKTPQSLHDPGEFIVGNILEDEDIAIRLNSYKFHERYHIGDNLTCNQCEINSLCEKGCPAAVIASGKRIEEVDTEVCPMAKPQ